MKTRFRLGATLAAALLVPPLLAAPASGSWAPSPVTGVVSPGCAAAKASADAAVDAYGVLRSFSSWHGGGCTSVRIRYASLSGTKSASTLSPYYGAVLAVADDGTTTWLLYRGSDGTRVGGRNRSGTWRTSYRVSGVGAATGDIAAYAGRWWVVWSEASGSLASLYNARTVGGTSRRTRITTAVSTDTAPALSLRPSGVAFLAFARRMASTGRREIVLFRKASPTRAWAVSYRATDGDPHEPDVVAVTDRAAWLAWRNGKRITTATNTSGTFVRRTLTAAGSRPRVAYSSRRFLVAWTTFGSPSKVVLGERSGAVTVERVLTPTVTTPRTAAAIGTYRGDATVAVLAASSLTAVRQRRPDITAFRGLGTWVDRLDYSLDPQDTVAAMKARGVRTLYLQTGKFDQTLDVIEPAKVGQWLEAAHASGIRVVGWYFPGYGSDLEKDVRRTLAIKSFRSPAGHRFDALGIDIERRGADTPSTFDADVATHLARVRSGVGPAYPVSAIVQAPVAMKIVPGAWSGFPWQTVGRHADVVQPMGYWTFRTDCSTNPAHCPYGYSKGNVQLARAYTGLPVHEVGGIHTEPAGRVVTSADIADFVAGTKAGGAIGGSLYDYRTTEPWFWSGLSAFN